MSTVDDGTSGSSGIAKSDEPKYAVVSCEVLPEVFLKVIEVKKLLACGGEKSSASACKRVGISRSAFYKYRDSVFTYEEKLTRRTISFYTTLMDIPGVLSAVLSELHKIGANVMTLNQSVPVDGAATVTVTVKLGESGVDGAKLKSALTKINGVVDFRLISEE